jgi:hypothetical protein
LERHFGLDREDVGELPSYVSAHKCWPDATSINCATILTRSPSLRTLPSSTLATCRRPAIDAKFSSRSRNGMTDERAITLSVRTLQSCAITSSVIPSAK